MQVDGGQRDTPGFGASHDARKKMSDISGIYRVSEDLKTKSSIESRLMEILVEYRNYRQYITNSAMHQNIVDKSILDYTCT